MSQGAGRGPRLSHGHPEFDRLIRESQAWLAERGETIVGSGLLPCRAGCPASIHTDFGPDDQDKDANQDYALAWWPHAAETRKALAFRPGDGRRADHVVPIGMGLGPGLLGRRAGLGRGRSGRRAEGPGQISPSTRPA